VRHWPWFAAGALALGIGLVWAISAGDSVQRLEVRFP
jgi:hypothetical protein